LASVLWLRQVYRTRTGSPAQDPKTTSILLIMASQMYCKVDGAPGESTDDSHQDYFDVLSYNHGLSQDGSGSASGVGGLSGGKATHAPFTVVKYVDKATNKLQLFSINGATKDVVIECWRHIGESNCKFMEYKLSKAVVASIQLNGGGGDRDTETVSFRYARIDWTYTQFDNQGRKLGDVKQWHDLTRNTWG